MSQNTSPFATQPGDSQGRLHREPESELRSCYQRDRDRIIHSTAFRRLKHKTQVFIAPHGDHFRTRLTHSIEVAQIARTMARSLGLNEDLTEALALAHDLGHPPFGHAGEKALNAAVRNYGGFDHNEQTLRILVSLEQRYAGFDGLNLTWETLEGIVKHNGPLTGLMSNKANSSSYIMQYNVKQDLHLDSHAGPEAQIAAIADDIAYDNHDIDDGLRAGAFLVSDFAEVPHVAETFDLVRTGYPGIEENRLIFETVRRLIGDMVEDVLAETRRRLSTANPSSAAEVRLLDYPIVAFSNEMRLRDRALKDFLSRHMYRHRDVMRKVGKAKRVVCELFAHFFENPEDMPVEWSKEAKSRDEKGVARVVTNYIAGMTDNYALNSYNSMIKRKVSL